MLHIHWPGWLLSHLAKLFAWLHNKKTIKPTCFEVNTSCYISILEPIATPSSPFWLISSNFGVVGPVFLTSFTFPSKAPMTMCKPCLFKSQCSYRTMVAKGSCKQGGHAWWPHGDRPITMTQPHRWIVWSMHITPPCPKWVLCCAIICPLLVSWCHNTPSLSTHC